MLGSLTAVAQPALENAVLNDHRFAQRNKARAETFEEVEGVEAGPVQFSLNASYSVGFNDNINTSQDDALQDLVQGPFVELGVVVPISRRSELNFAIGVGYDIYWHHEGYNRLRISPGTELAYDVQINDVFITVFDRVSYTEDVTTAPDLANQTRAPRLGNAIGTQITWAPDRILVAGGYSYQITYSTDSDYDYLNRASHLPFLRGGYLFAEGAGNAGLELSVTFTDYESDLTDDSSIVSFGPYVDWQISDAIYAGLRGGFLYLVNSITLLPEDTFDTSSFYAGLDVTHDLTEYISQGLSISHGARPSLEQGAAFTEQTRVGYRLAWAVMDDTSLSFNAGYVHGEQSVAAGVDPSEVFDQWRIGGRLSHNWSPRLSTALAYSYVNRSSDRDGRGYTQNRVDLILGYQFQ
jgi:hypothetical protein